MNEAAGDYRLQSGSPARNGGVDILDLNRSGSTTDLINMGAYITGTEVIGRGSSDNAPSTEPSPPTSVTVE